MVFFLNLSFSFSLSFSDFSRSVFVCKLFLARSLSRSISVFQCLCVYTDFQSLSLAYTRGTKNSPFALNLSFSSLNLSFIFFHSSTPLSLLHTQRKGLSFLSISFLSFSFFFGLSLFSIPLACSLFCSFSVFQSLCLSLVRAFKSLNLFNPRFFKSVSGSTSLCFALSFSFNLIFSDSPNPLSLSSLHMQRKRFVYSLNTLWHFSLPGPISHLHALTCCLSRTLQTLSYIHARSTNHSLSLPISFFLSQSLFSSRNFSLRFSVYFSDLSNPVSFLYIPCKRLSISQFLFNYFEFLSIFLNLFQSLSISLYFSLLFSTCC